VALSGGSVIPPFSSEVEGKAAAQDPGVERVLMTLIYGPAAERK